MSWGKRIGFAAMGLTAFAVLGWFVPVVPAALVVALALGAIFAICFGIGTAFCCIDSESKKSEGEGITTAALQFAGNAFLFLIEVLCSSV